MSSTETIFRFIQRVNGHKSATDRSGFLSGQKALKRPGNGQCLLHFLEGRQVRKNGGALDCSGYLESQSCVAADTIVLSRLVASSHVNHRDLYNVVGSKPGRVKEEGSFFAKPRIFKNIGSESKSIGRHWLRLTPQCILNRPLVRNVEL